MYNYSLFIGTTLGPYTSGIGLFPSRKSTNNKSRQIYMIDLCFIHLFLYNKNKLS